MEVGYPDPYPRQTGKVREADDDDDDIYIRELHWWSVAVRNLQRKRTPLCSV